MGTRSFRSKVFSIHRFLGRYLAIFFAFTFLTGTILLISDELEAVFHPAIWSAPAASDEKARFADIYQSVTDSFPHGQLFIIERQPQPWLADRSYVTTGWGEKIVVWTDPVSSQVVDVTMAENFRSILRDLHDSLFVPRRIGFVLVSSTSILLLGILLAGLVTYRRFWKGFFRWPTGKETPRARKGVLHRLYAVWVFVFLLIISVTGVFFTLTGLGFDGSIPGPPPASSRIAVLPEGFSSTDLERAQQAAETAGDYEFAAMGLPDTAAGGIGFYGFPEGSSQIFGETSITVDPANFQILGTIGPDQFAGNARLKPIMTALHYGHWGGAFSRALWFGFAMLGIALIFAGMKVAFHRDSDEKKQENTTGFAAFLLPVGFFKWVYLLVALGVLFVGLIRFGPTAEKWTSLRPVDAHGYDIKIQILGNLRANTPAGFRSINLDERVTEIQMVPAQDQGLIKTKNTDPATKTRLVPVQSNAPNEIHVILTLTSGESVTLPYIMGATIW